MLVTESLCWRFVQCNINLFNRSPTSHTCCQHISSPTSITNIDVTMDSLLLNLLQYMSLFVYLLVQVWIYMFDFCWYIRKPCFWMIFLKRATIIPAGSRDSGSFFHPWREIHVQEKKYQWIYLCYEEWQNTPDLRKLEFNLLHLNQLIQNNCYRNICYTDRYS